MNMIGALLYFGLVVMINFARALRRKFINRKCQDYVYIKVEYWSTM